MKLEIQVDTIVEIEILPHENRCYLKNCRVTHPIILNRPTEVELEEDTQKQIKLSAEVLAKGLIVAVRTYESHSGQPGKLMTEIMEKNQTLYVTQANSKAPKS